MLIKNVRKYFIAGLLAGLPLFATIYVLMFIYNMAVKAVEKIIPIKTISEMFVDYNAKLASVSELVSFLVATISILIIMFSVMVLGFLVSHFFNRSKIKSLELIILRIPLAKSLYSTFKQLSKLVFSKDTKSYKKTVLIEYPRKGIYSLALVTNEKNEVASEVLGREELYNLFVPTSPNPTSGVFLIVPIEETIELDIKIDDAFKMIISGGAIIPSENIENLKRGAINEKKV
jgi:uncharacterized membrane protein